MLNSIKVGFIVLLTLFTSLNVQAAGIALGATRVIYPRRRNRLLWQSVIAIFKNVTSSIHGSKIAPGRKKNVYRYAAFIRQRTQKRKHAAYYLRRATATRDRESLFWMNVKAIPSVDKSHIEGKRSATGDSVAHQTVRASGEFAADAGRRADLAEIFPCRQPSQDNQPICLLPHAGQYQRGREKIDNVMIAPKATCKFLTDWRAGQRDISDRQ